MSVLSCPVPDAENARKRAERDISTKSKHAITDFAKSLIAVSDNLSRALEMADQVLCWLFVSHVSFARFSAAPVTFIRDERRGLYYPQLSKTRKYGVMTAGFSFGVFPHFSVLFV